MAAWGPRSRPGERQAAGIGKRKGGGDPREPADERTPTKMTPHFDGLKRRDPGVEQRGRAPAAVVVVVVVISVVDE